MNIIQYATRVIKLNAFDFALLLITNLGYYAAGIFLLHQWGITEYKGLFTASLGVVNLLLAFIFFKRKSIDKNFIYLLIGLTLSFISLTAPVQLKGNYIILVCRNGIIILVVSEIIYTLIKDCLCNHYNTYSYKLTDGLGAGVWR